MMRYYILFLLWVLIVGGINQSFSRDLPTTPFLQNYSKSVYKAGTQNWQILQASNDVMYFANNYGVLRFDGNYWQLAEVDNHSVVRSVCNIGEDTIMVGAYGEFGIMTSDTYGELKYQSWVNKLPNNHRGFHEVWRIYKVNEFIYIQTFSDIFVFKNGVFESHFSPKNTFKYLFFYQNELLVQDLKIGVFSIEGDSLKHLPEFDFYNDMEIWTMLPFKDDKMIVGTQLEGLFVKKGSENYIWNTEANEFLKKNNLFSGIKMSNGNYVFGSIQNGLIIVNDKGGILSFINSSVGLQNNTVLSLFEDKTGNLWLGLDNGIDYALTNAPLYKVKKKGGFGMGYSSVLYEKRLYAGTNQGLFYIEFDENESVNKQLLDFVPINSAKGQVWKLKVIDDMLFVCHNFGLFVIKNNKISKISINTGVWDIEPIAGDSDHYLVGTYHGFYRYSASKGTAKAIRGFDDPARRFKSISDGSILVSHGYKGIYNVKLNYSSLTANLVKHHNSSNGLPNNYGNEIFKIRDKLIAATDSGVYYYTNSTFKYYSIWDKFFNNDAGQIYSIHEASNSNIYCFKNGNLYKLIWLNDEMFDLQSDQFATIANTFPRSFENILELPEERYLIGNEEGFVLYNDKSSGVLNADVSISLHNAKYIDEATNNQLRVPFIKNNKTFDLGNLRYKQNSLLLLFSIPYYIKPSNIHFKYRLNKGPWSDWVEGHELLLNDLREGEYFIDIECTGNLKDVSGFLSVRVTIDPPLHRTWYSYLFYLLLFFASTLLSSYFIKKKISYERRKESITQQKRMIEHRIKLKRKTELAQAELTSLKNEKLKTDIRHKSKELANTTMSIIHKNQMLQQIKEVLLKLGKNDVKYAENKELSRLIKRINKEIDHQDNWTVFEKNFDKVHENFLQRIKEKHPDLTPKDLRLAAYLRMNLSSKEIAPLLNISVRSVEISRYRLRKKINLHHDQNLTEYLISS